MIIAALAAFGRDYTPQEIENPNVADRRVYVADPGNLVGSDVKERVNGMLYDLRRQTSAEVAVVVVPSIGDIPIEDFTEQVKLHTNLIKKEFGVKPTAFRNTELIYSDEIGAMVAGMGFRTMLAEGAKHVLGWKSPNYVYANAIDQKLRLLLRNYKLSDDIAFRFSNKSWDQWPLTADKYVQWLASDETPGEVINLFMDYETFGEHQNADTGIFEFMRALPKAILARKNGLEFATVTEAAKKHQPVAVLHCPHVMSWADEERDVTAWLGNELQNEAFSKLYAQKEKVAALKNPDFDYVWSFMQTSDHFYYMATKWLSDGDVHSYFNPYDSAYDAFINYMNVLSDFIIELDKAVAAKAAKKRA